MRKYQNLSMKIGTCLLIIFTISGLFADNNDESIEYNGYDTAMTSILWMQHSAEYEALCRQAYNIAKLRLQQDMTKRYDKPKAVVLDIDETVLNNMPYNARKITNYGQERIGFYDWVELAIAELIPGAKDFIEYADKNGYEVFYISNRRNKYLKATIDNLEKYDLPNADKLHVLLKSKGNTKQKRREKVTADYHIVLLVGDNILDFYQFEDSNKVRRRQVKEMQELFGKKFILLPNPVRGSWEKAFYHSDEYLPINERNKIKRSLLKDF